MVHGDSPRPTRRQLLTGAGLAAAAVGLAGCGKKPGAEVSGRAVHWKQSFDVPIRTPMTQTTLVVAGDRLYATHEGSLLAYSAATGAPLWTSAEGTLAVLPPPAPLVDGNTLLLQRQDGPGVVGALHAIDTATGALRWKYGSTTESGFNAWPAAAGGIACYSGSGSYAALDVATGRTLWTRRHRILGQAFPYGAPAMNAHTIFMPDEGGIVGALDARTGKLRWIAPGSGEDVGLAGPALIGGLLVSVKSDHVSAYDAATGKRRWSTSSEGALLGNARPQSDGKTLVFLGSSSAPGSDNTVLAFNLTDGTRRWSATIEGRIGEQCAVADGVAYVPSKGALTALDLSTGASRWVLRSAKATFSMPAASNGLVHVFALAPDDELYGEDVLYAVTA